MPPPPPRPLLLLLEYPEWSSMSAALPPAWGCSGDSCRLPWLPSLLYPFRLCERESSADSMVRWCISARCHSTAAMPPPPPLPPPLPPGEGPPPPLPSLLLSSSSSSTL